jgi:hypothetical protein
MESIHVCHYKETRNELSLIKLDTALLLGLGTEIYGPVLLLEKEEAEDNVYCSPPCHRMDCRVGVSVINREHS